MTRARFSTVAILRDLVAIEDNYDEADPTMSVTNDIEAVVADLVARRIINPRRQKLIYRDTEGVWDQVVIDDNLRPIAFSPLRVKTLGEAIVAARRPLGRRPMPSIVQVVSVVNPAYPTRHEGRYVVRWNPHTHAGLEFLDIETTAAPNKARRFNGAEYLDEWRTVSRVEPRRPWDGLPNRPLTVLTIESIEVPK